jgi:putative ABC transport system ATP-binding protein
VPAVRGVSFSVPRGEFIAIVGPSGSGKSTLFYLLGGLTRATRAASSSTASILPRSTTRAHPPAQAAHRLRLPALQPAAHAHRHGQYRDRPRHQRPEAAARHAYLDHLSDCSIKGRLGHRPSELSGGEQQRVAIARALITRPAIILADEPTGNLDTKNSDAVLAMLRRSNKELGQTVLMITHNLKRQPSPTAFSRCATARSSPDRTNTQPAAAPHSQPRFEGASSSNELLPPFNGHLANSRSLTAFRPPDILN